MSYRVYDFGSSCCGIPLARITHLSPVHHLQPAEAAFAVGIPVEESSHVTVPELERKDMEVHEDQRLSNLYHYT